MSTKLLRNIIIVFQIIITASIMLADACGIATLQNVETAKPMIESLIRCLATLAFTIFYYVSVADSFSSDNLFFPLYLLFLSISETRVLEIVAKTLNFVIIPPQYLPTILIMSGFMLAFSIIGYCLLTTYSIREINTYTVASLVISLTIAIYGSKGCRIDETWNSKILLSLLVLFYSVGVVIALIQTVKETVIAQKIRYAVGAPLLINNYVNLVYNTNSMNLIGTTLFIISIGLIILLVRINTARM